MAQGFDIQTPRGRVFTTRTRNGQVTARLEWASGFGPQASNDFSQAQTFVDQECLRYIFQTASVRRRCGRYLPGTCSMSPWRARGIRYSWN